MAIPRLFKLPRHREFEYQPLYYDPVKEEREKRNREIERELGLNTQDDVDFKTGIRRGSMRHYIRSQKRATRNSNLRLFIIISILFFLAYLLLYT